MKISNRILFLILFTILIFPALNNTAYAIADNTLVVTESEIKSLAEQTSGEYLNLNYSERADVSAIKVMVNPSWLAESGKGLSIQSGTIGGLVVSKETWKEISELEGNGTVSLTLKQGRVNLERANNNEDLNYFSFSNPMLLSMPYDTPIDGDYVVMYQNKGTQEPKHLIPRSWYDSEMVFAYIYSAGEFGVQNMGKTVLNDTAGKWMDDASNYVAARMVITGEEQGVFMPEKHISRAEFVSMIMGMFDIQLQGLWMPRPFNDQQDVPEWASNDVLQATAMGILQADSNNNFHPNDGISRQDMFVITYNLLQKLGVVEQSDGGMVLKEFKDGDQLAKYAYIPMLTLVQNGMVKGDGYMLNPDRPSTKAEAAQFLYNVFQYDIKNAKDKYEINREVFNPIMVSTEGDVTGDKILDRVYFKSTMSSSGPFAEDITLTVQDGKTGQSTDILLENNVGYHPTLFLGDFNGDEVSDMLVRIDSGGSGAFTYDYLYSFLDSRPKLLFSSDIYNETYGYDVAYVDYYKVKLVSLNNSETYLLDISSKGDEYLNQIYGTDHKLFQGIKGFINPLSALFPVDADNDGVYDLLAFQKIAGLYNADSLGYVENFLTWGNGEFQLFNQYVGIHGTN